MPSPYENVLFVGPHHKNHRGGIGAVLEIYARHITPFKYVPTLAYQNKFYELFFFTFSLIRIFFKLLTDRKIRIVHIHGAKDGSIFRKFFVCFIAKKIFRKKIIFHIHAGAFDEKYLGGGKLYRAMCRFLVNNSSALIVLSNKWDNFFRSNFRIRRLVVLRNPVERRMDNYSVTNNNELQHYLFLGRIADHKGIFDLVQLVIDEQGQLRGKCKFLVGGNHEVDRFKKIVSDNNITDLAEYIGWVQEEDKDRFYKSCNYFILPTYEEAMPMTILEAFSYAKPVISTPVGSIPEILEHDYNGLLFEPGDMPALKKLILETLHNPDLEKRLGNNALTKATEFYPATIKQELEKLYAEIV